MERLVVDSRGLLAEVKRVARPTHLSFQGSGSKKLRVGFGLRL